KGTYVRLQKFPAEGMVVRGARGIDVGDSVRVRLVRWTWPRALLTLREFKRFGGRKGETLKLEIARPHAEPGSASLRMLPSISGPWSASAQHAQRKPPSILERLDRRGDFQNRIPHGCQSVILVGPREQ